MVKGLKLIFHLQKTYTVPHWATQMFHAILQWATRIITPTMLDEQECIHFPDGVPNIVSHLFNLVFDLSLFFLFLFSLCLLNFSKQTNLIIGKGWAIYFWGIRIYICLRKMKLGIVCNNSFVNRLIFQWSLNIVELYNSHCVILSCIIKHYTASERKKEKISKWQMFELLI
jgi:hypothetical protein